jgi:putative hydrolase
LTYKLLKLDLHVHSKFSDGESTLQELASAARAKGLKALGVADHYASHPLRLHGRMGRGRLKEYLSQAAAAGLLKAVEVDIYEDGGVSLEPSERGLFDYIIGGVHRVGGVDFWGDPSPIPDPEGFMEAVRVALVEALEGGLIDIVAHLTWLPEDLRGMERTLITDGWVESVVRAAASRGVAVEVSGAWEVPSEEVVRRCLKEGVKLSLGSDAHRLSEVGNLSYPLKLLARLGAGVEDLFIPKPLRELGDWEP